MRYKEFKCKGYDRHRGLRQGDFLLKERAVGGGELLVPKYPADKKASFICDRVVLKPHTYDELMQLSYLDCLQYYVSEIEISVKVILTKDNLDKARDRFIHLWLESTAD